MKKILILEHSLIVLLLIKNLWNIINSVLMRITKTTASENFNYFSLIIIKEGFNSVFEYSSYLKLHILGLLYEKFIKKDLQNIAKLSSGFHSLIYLILDSCIVQFKIINEIKEDDNLIKEVMNMGFNRLDIIGAMQEGYKTADEIVNNILSNNIEKNVDEPDEESKVNNEPNNTINENNRENLNGNQENNQNRINNGEASDPNQINLTSTNINNNTNQINNQDGNNNIEATQNKEKVNNTNTSFNDLLSKTDFEENLKIILQEFNFEEL